MAFVPTVDVSGLYQLKTPFDTQILPNVKYTCESVRSIQDVSANGESAFDSVYVPVGLTQDVFNADVAAGVKIVTLVADRGNRIVVPSSYIVGMPDLSGVPYTGTILAIDLSILPTNLNLDYLKERLLGVVRDTIGVKVEEVKTIVSTAPMMMTPEQHRTIEATRQLVITETESDYAKVFRLTNEIAQLRQKNQLMEEWIRDHPPA